MSTISIRDIVTPLTPPGQPLSVGALLDRIGLERPVLGTVLADVVQPVRLTFALRAGSSSGMCVLDVSPDGSVVYTGHVHDGGVLDTKYGAITVVPVLVVGVPVIVQHIGWISGKLGLGSRDDDWREIGTSAFIATNWAAFRAATAKAYTKFGTDTGLTEILSSLLGGGTGIWVFSL